MLFHVIMDVEVPAGLDLDRLNALKSQEKARAQELQREGKWRHLWRIAGRYSNVSVFDVDSPQELHDIISALPLFPFMRVAVTPLCRHPSSVRDDDR